MVNVESLELRPAAICVPRSQGAGELQTLERRQGFSNCSHCSTVLHKEVAGRPIDSNSPPRKAGQQTPNCGACLWLCCRSFVVDGSGFCALGTGYSAVTTNAPGFYSGQFTTWVRPRRAWAALQLVLPDCSMHGHKTSIHLHIPWVATPLAASKGMPQHGRNLHAPLPAHASMV